MNQITTDQTDDFEDIDYEPGEPEEINETCPDCKSNKMICYMQANGPDDYDWVYECRGCGTTQST